MKKITIIIAILLVSGFGFAQSGAKIEFNTSDNTIDYGTVTKNNDNGTRTIEFTNTGDAPLIISNVLSTSGFSISSIPNTPIGPKKTGRFDIKYNMVPGPIRKTITIESNAVNHPEGRAVIKIKGEVTN